ncbi:PorP/SprF family type IX secretion system membrane protein [Rufibacter latericius]|uniref:Type IX secretion system membrane protein PorP/SprF n=1 Tax=Rufibacter latericius TaxID=2487040 RepID=A0A3M9MD79_9BACT|nr:PorP/SprF family type IX secretion system membrane protein [Rufibacter latericius]RNI23521.1 type IX secretion system membrane protein PorP/SprF [Rufibacter latericius]
MKHKSGFLIFILGLLFPFLGQAQQLPQFSHYGFNGQFISPGYAGVKGQTELNVLYRYQWLGYDGTFDAGGSPKTALFTVSAPITSLKSGIGLVVMKDEIGAVDIFNAQLAYSYHLSVGGGTLGIGVQGGLTNMSKGGYRANEQGDVRVPFNSSDRKFDMGAGLWFQHTNWYAGAGITNLLGASYQFENQERDGNFGTVTGEKHLMVTGGYELELSSDIDVTPTALLKRDMHAGVTSLEAGARATFNDKFWGGAGYRFGEAITGLLGVYLLKDNALSFGYAFDYTAVGTDAKSATSHEVMVGYRFPKPKNNTKPPIRTPRYFF